MSLPPLPEGFTVLEESSALPPLPEGFTVYNAAEEPKGTNQGRIGDFIDNVQGAFIDSFASDAKAVELLAGSETAGQLADAGFAAGEAARSTLSKDAIEAQSKEWISSKDDELLGDAWGDIDSWLSGTASAIGSLGAIIAGGGVTKAIAGLGIKGTAKALGKNADFIKKGSRGDSLLGAVSYGVNEGLMMGGSAGQAVEQEILNMDQGVLEQSDAYIETVNEMRAGGVSEEEIPTQARAAVARTLGAMAVKDTALVGAALGTIGGKYLNDAFTKRLAGDRLQRAGAVAASEALTEAPQEGYQQFAQNRAIGEVDPNQDLMQGVANAAVAGGLFGGIAGGGLGALSQDADPTAETAFNKTPIPTMQELGMEPIDLTEKELIEGPPATPDYTVDAAGRAAEGGAQAFDQGMQSGAERVRQAAQTQTPLIEQQGEVIPAGEPDVAPGRPDYMVNTQGEAMTPETARIDQVVPQPRTPLIENEGMIYGEAPLKEGEFKPLETITITNTYTIDETGETVEISERADKLFSIIDRRRGMLNKLMECVSA